MDFLQNMQNMSDERIDSFLDPPVSPYVWSSCAIHGSWCTPSDCLVTKMGYAIHYGDRMTIERLIRLGTSPDSSCHMNKHSLKVEYPLNLVTSPMYHHRSDACFLALLEAGASLRSQAESEEELRDLKRQLRIFAFRPEASPEALMAVLDMGVADTESERDHLVDVATMRCWYHGDDQYGNDIWTLQDEFLYIRRKAIVLKKVTLSLEQKAKF